MKKLVLALLWLYLPVPMAFAQSQIRLAVVDFVGDEGREISNVLRVSAQSSSGEFELLDDDLVRAAARGAGYAGSLNLSRAEARTLGQSIGCDFYLLGKRLVARRLAKGEQFYFEALAGVFLVETRSGRLIKFWSESTKAENEVQALKQLKEILRRHWPLQAQLIVEARQRYAAFVENVPQTSAPPIEVLTDDLTATGVQQPFFYQRIKPDYTEQADLAGIAATVELEAVFRDDGTVGEVEVVKWAGFGLDESATETVKKLRFKPAERDGKKLTLQGLVRYNFRRPLSQAAPETKSQEETERLRRGLRDIKKVPTQIPGRRPNF